MYYAQAQKIRRSRHKMWAFKSSRATGDGRRTYQNELIFAGIGKQIKRLEY